MYKKLLSLALAAALSVSLLCAAAGALGLPTTPKVPLSLANPDESVLLYNVTHETVVLAQNTEVRRPIASITKLMTALLLLENPPNLNQTVTVPERLQPELTKIEENNGYTLDIVVGERFKLRDLFYMALMGSANDATSVLADWFSGGDLDGFVGQMNARAEAMGLTDTHFCGVHGLYEEDNYSTAQDLLVLARTCYENELFRQLTDNSFVTLSATNKREEKVLRSTNRCLRSGSTFYRTYAHPIKNGFTTPAGYCNIMAGEQDGETYILIILGSTEGGLYYECTGLLDWAFYSLTPTPVAAAGSAQTIAPVYNALLPEGYTPASLPSDSGEDGEENSEEAPALPAGCFALPLTAAEEVTLCLTRKQTVSVTCDVDRLTAPLAAGDKCGTMTVWVDGAAVRTVPLLAAQAVEAIPGGAAKSAAAAAAYWLMQLCGWTVVAVPCLITLGLLWARVLQLKNRRRRRAGAGRK